MRMEKNQNKKRSKGELLWKILTAIMLIIIIWGVFGVVQSYQEGDYLCPIIDENGTRTNVPCWMLPNCEEIGCARCHYSCGRPGCDCRPNAHEFGHCD